MVMLTPAGAEAYLAQLHGAIPTASPDRDIPSGEAIERLLTTAARLGIYITGPPPSQI